MPEWTGVKTRLVKERRRKQRTRTRKWTERKREKNMRGFCYICNKIHRTKPREAHKQTCVCERVRKLAEDGVLDPRPPPWDAVNPPPDPQPVFKKRTVAESMFWYLK